ncbi:hypothetical protein MTR67_002809 [Solanum verrucosum]|uniref:Integrase catalytic domain-containing protein n=1 Tax=Solanum verrucosum TaxID=315347 RepID=A0AAF0PWW4_SOLVR|nr:hypothetical protein MTR67_002809 [Solanum verrucosum]
MEMEEIEPSLLQLLHQIELYLDELLQGVSTPDGESILAERVYRDCSISVNHKSTLADLVELDMVDFDVILAEVKEKQDSDPILLQLKGAIDQQRFEVFSQGGDGVLRYQDRLCVPKEVFWCNGMKRDIADFVAKCRNCQQVKVEHQKPGGMTQKINIPTWKWEVIHMDFIIGLPHIRRQHDSIWVIVDRVNKFAWFLVVKTTNSVEDYAKLYINEIVRLHGIPLSIISDKGPQFTSYFWKSFQKGLGTQVNLSTAFHPQTDGQGERTIQTLKDMLRTCVIHFKSSWDDHFSLIEFAYNNSYHSSI